VSGLAFFILGLLGGIFLTLLFFTIQFVDGDK